MNLADVEVHSLHKAPQALTNPPQHISECVAGMVWAQKLKGIYVLIFYSRAERDNK